MGYSTHFTLGSCCHWEVIFYSIQPIFAFLVFILYDRQHFHISIILLLMLISSFFYIQQGSISLPTKELIILNHRQQIASGLIFLRRINHLSVKSRLKICIFHEQELASSGCPCCNWCMRFSSRILRIQERYKVGIVLVLFRSMNLSKCNLFC